MGKSLRGLGFLTIGLFDGDSPRAGHESTLEIIELGERLGFDTAWVRHRHLQYGISSPTAVLAAASQRTRRIGLGTAVIPLGWENPLRLAEDLATVDLLSGGRLNPGISVGTPMRFDHVKEALYPTTADHEDFTYTRAERLLRYLRGEVVAEGGREGFEVYSGRVEPHSAGLAERVWYGGGSLRSARWAGRVGVNFLTDNVVRAEESENFGEIQRGLIRAFREEHPEGDGARVTLGVVLIPTDSASKGQKEKYEEYAAKRLPRTERPQGAGRVMFAPDVVGTTEQIVEQLHKHPAFREVDELAAALPFTFEHEDYVQILTDLATGLGPALGWSPKTG
ncbi:LLM class flavin-dependent oxidoreductase [Saccharothrix sp.]|uniref:LLM class flavin-dependent oxidoreductase n=1 Tax=Saccharothrix sp. TaxID=1873460 RepID=UPI0028109CB0|nr:LLM class flavin-dependent oxidoreductase [Saccharothrix sp.]